MIQKYYNVKIFLIDRFNNVPINPELTMSSDWTKAILSWVLFEIQNNFEWDKFNKNVVLP